MTEETPEALDPTSVAIAGDEAVAPASPENPHVEIDGSPEGGWIGQVHTGDVAHVFTCAAESLEAAKTEVMRLYAEYANRPKEPDGASGAA